MPTERDKTAVTLPNPLSHGKYPSTLQLHLKKAQIFSTTEILNNLKETNGNI